jgi:pantoate--beta-alanine ligase
MERVTTVREMRDLVRRLRGAGARIAFVPTMGALHDGHLSLVEAARREADCVVMSIFVNPLQFGPSEDFTRYPRPIDADASKAEGQGVDVLFCPTVEEMYPGNTEVRVEAPRLAAQWEGAVRPGHFSGVLTVVAKLFHAVLPDTAVFGRKDLQQSVLVQQMVRDLDFPLRIVVAPTVREADGLALSSRNVYLDQRARSHALSLVRALRRIASLYAGGERHGPALEQAGHTVAEESGGVSIDYLAVVDPETLDRVDQATDASAAIVAAKVGSTRLIDNMILGQPE